MWEDLVVDLLPWGGSGDPDRGTKVMRRFMPDRLYIPQTDSPGAIKRVLNESGWVDGEVVAAGDLRQGKEPTVASMLLGTALIEALRPQRAKTLPSHFVLAATADRAVAFSVISTGSDEVGGTYELWLRPEEAGSWPRGSVRLVDLRKGAASTAGTLEIDGVASAPVYRPSHDPSSQELFTLLAR